MTSRPPRPKQLDELASLARRARGIAPSARGPAAREYVGNSIRELARRARRRFATGQVRIVQIAFGPRAANRYFWVAPTNRPIWFDVENRIEHLERKLPAYAADFVTRSLERTSDPVTVAGLARHPSTRDLTREWLATQVDAPSNALAERLRGNRLLGGALSGAADLLLDPEQAGRFATWVDDLYQLPDSRLFQFRDSLGYRPAHRDAGRADDVTDVAGRGRPARHRLVIADNFADQDSVVLVLPGAERVTLIATSETFGMADLLTHAGRPGVGDLTVEHIRSRVTRFSREYAELHEATAEIARQLTAEVERVPGLIHPADRAIVAVEIADFLFFQSLKVRAIERLLEDPTFDHIVLATGNHPPTHEFVRLVAGVRGLLDDPRVEIISTARSAGLRASFWSLIDELHDPVTPTLPASEHVPDDLVLRKFHEDARHLTAEMGPIEVAGNRPWALLVTANNEAYNYATAGFVHDLLPAVDVRLVNMGRDASSLIEHLRDLGVREADAPVHFLPVMPPRFRPLAELLQARLQTFEPTVTGRPEPTTHAATWALRASLPRLTLEAIAPAVARLWAMQHWFEQAERARRLPDVVLLTPQRTPAVTAVAQIARRFGVPTIGLEPHAHDANYSRYLKVGADFYGVMSDYFRSQANAGFDLPLDRIRTIGSPRQIAPAGYDPAAERARARAAFEHRTGHRFDPATVHLVFFCQPSDWGHVSRIWSSILTAAHEQDAVVLLKTHPEESVSRTHQYLLQARSHGMADRVVLLDVDAAEAIALSDLVLTAYSAAAIDAAVRQRPVVCVTDGDVRYPVDIPAIVGADLARSAAELSAIIAGFRADPQAFDRRARSLLEREDQFLHGPGPRLRGFVRDVVELGRDGIRSPDELPDWYFLDEPHPEYPV